MSMVLDAEDTLPTISDSLGSEFSIRTRKAVDGATLLIVRLTLDREIPEDYTLWVNEQEIILN